jgi:hypothetical protein
MGALTTTDQETGEHVATSKSQAAGTRHQPQWGEWLPDGPCRLRQCEHPDCDLDDYEPRKLKEE